MSPAPSDLDVFCVDCRDTDTQPPRLAVGRSPRCPEHQQQRRRHVDQGRQARQRARRNSQLPPTPTAYEWARQYQPQPLRGTRIEAVLLDAADLEELAAVVAELRETMDAGNNAYRGEDPTATRHALRDLLDRAYEAVSVLEQMPGVGPTPRSSSNSL